MLGRLGRHQFSSSARRKAQILLDCSFLFFRTRVIIQGSACCMEGSQWDLGDACLRTEGVGCTAADTLGFAVYFSGQILGEQGSRRPRVYPFNVWASDRLSVLVCSIHIPSPLCSDTPRVVVPGTRETKIQPRCEGSSWGGQVRGRGGRCNESYSAFTGDVNKWLLVKPRASRDTVKWRWSRSVVSDSLRPRGL